MIYRVGHERLILTRSKSLEFGNLFMALMYGKEKDGEAATGLLLTKSL